jgi:hypothetical protein
VVDAGCERIRNARFRGIAPRIEVTPACQLGLEATVRTGVVLSGRAEVRARDLLAGAHSERLVSRPLADVVLVMADVVLVEETAPELKSINGPRLLNRAARA